MILSARTKISMECPGLPIKEDRIRSRKKRRRVVLGQWAGDPGLIPPLSVFFVFFLLKAVANNMPNKDM